MSDNGLLLYRLLFYLHTKLEGNPPFFPQSNKYARKYYTYNVRFDVLSKTFNCFHHETLNFMSKKFNLFLLFWQKYFSNYFHMTKEQTWHGNIFPGEKQQIT